MALTKAQEIALYQALEVPYGNVVGIFRDQNNQLAARYVADDPSRSAHTLIQNHLAALDSDVEAVLTDYLDEWIGMDTDATVVESGNVGSLSQVLDNPIQTKMEIRRCILTIVPYCREWFSDQARRSGSGGIIPVVR